MHQKTYKMVYKQTSTRNCTSPSHCKNNCMGCVYELVNCLYIPPTNPIADVANSNGPLSVVHCNCVCAVTKFLPAKNFCRLLRVKKNSAVVLSRWSTESVWISNIPYWGWVIYFTPSKIRTLLPAWPCTVLACTLQDVPAVQGLSSGLLLRWPYCLTIFGYNFCSDDLLNKIFMSYNEPMNTFPFM